MKQVQQCRKEIIADTTTLKIEMEENWNGEKLMNKSVICNVSCMGFDNELEMNKWEVKAESYVSGLSSFFS